MNDELRCAKCPSKKKACRAEDGTGPEWCPTVREKEMIDAILGEYDRPENSRFAKQAAIQEGEAYADRDRRPYVMNPVKTRIEEIVEFSGKMGYAKLGLAFCAGLEHEASLFSGVLEKRGFQVVSVSCKIGGIPKERLGIRDEEKIRIGEFESICNPIAQATLLNAAGTEFNIVLGLCVGHDSLFFKYIGSPVTVLAAKDRVTCHNPLAPLYTSRTYYQKLKTP